MPLSNPVAIHQNPLVPITSIKMQFKLATVMLIAGALAAPAEVERRGDRKDQWTQDGMNCWGRNDPGNAGMMEVAIHISGIEM